MNGLQQVAQDIRDRPDSDPAGILEEHFGALLETCDQALTWAQQYMGQGGVEPEWLLQMSYEVVTFKDDLFPEEPYVPQDR